jgi:hypothetical protein
VACQRDLIWHTDLHDLGGQLRLIAFIHDCSRRIMGWSILDNKRSGSVA